MFKVQTVEEFNFKKTDYSTVFFDVETLTMNSKFSVPSEMKVRVYVLTVGIFNLKKTKLYLKTYPNFIKFLNDLPKNSEFDQIELVAHNSDKYDNHFLAYELKNEGLRFFNFDYNNSDKASDRYRREAPNLKKVDKVSDRALNYVIEHRVRSSNRLSLNFCYNQNIFKTVDTYPKTQKSLLSIGLELNEAGLLLKDYLKSSLDYNKFDLPYALDIYQERAYLKKCYELTVQDPNDLKYILNDIIILAAFFMYYNVLYKDYDFNLLTLTSNILKEYVDKGYRGAQQQLTLSGKVNFKRFKVNYSDYESPLKMDFNELFRKFYYGGLNFFNDSYVNKTVHNLFHVDLNSSYPNVMFNELVPEQLNEITTNGQVEVDNNYYDLYIISVNEFEKMLNSVESVLLKKIFIKYFCKHSRYVYLSTPHFQTLYEVARVNVSSINYVYRFRFLIEKFKGRNVIDKYYRIKTEGKKGLKIRGDSTLSNVIFSDEKSEKKSKLEISFSKLPLNSIYGATVLRDAYDLFFTDLDGSLKNVKKGHLNTERNIVFGGFVTAYAFRNLLMPLKYLTPKEIDEYVYYGDTDSLFLSLIVFSKIPKSIYNKFSLGKWDIEHELIVQAKFFNHKKYILELPDKSTVCASGGVNLASFGFKDNKSPNYRTLNQFMSDGREVISQASIMTKEKLIGIYERSVNLDAGHEYDIDVKKHLEKVQTVKNDLKNLILNSLDIQDYFEIEEISISKNDLIKVERKSKKLKGSYDLMRDMSLLFDNI